jgi:N-acetylmuramoyl-L-alanine amidase
MSFFQRAAAIAVTTLCFTGMIGASTPGIAKELDRSAIVASSVVSITNPSIPALVPALPTNAQTQVEPIAPQANPDADDDSADAPLAYATLAAAVDAQDVPDAVSDDMRCLAGAIYFESKGEPLAGQLAVADVILNRTKSGRFPKSVCSVITQRGQFSFVRGGQVPDIADGNQYRTALAVAQIALNDGWQSPAPKALYFHARSTSTGWNREQVASIGNHIFYR